MSDQKQTLGFSIMTAMIGSIVVAALAVVYMQKARNRAQVAAIADIIAYRDYVFRYYSEVIANRMAWQCTKKVNADLLTYVNTGGGALGPHNLQVQDVDGTGCVVGAGTGKEAIPGTGAGLGTEHGLGLKLYTDLPVDPITADDWYDSDPSSSKAHDLRVYATWEGLGRNAVRVRLAAAYNYEHDQAITSFKIKEKETFIYMNRTTARNCSDGLSAGFGFYDDGGTGTSAPERYFGDTAVTSVNAETRLVTCWEQGPLVIPPCYDLQERVGHPIGFKASCPSLGTDKMRNYAGICPDSRPKVPALGGFAADTGKTICEVNYALVLGRRDSNNPRHCRDIDHEAFVGITANHEGVCRSAGAIGRRCADGYKGWNSGIADCWGGSKRGEQGIKGQPGLPNVLPAEQGDPGPNVTCTLPPPSSSGGAGSCPSGCRDRTTTSTSGGGNSLVTCHGTTRCRSCTTGMTATCDASSASCSSCDYGCHNCSSWCLEDWEEWYPDPNTVCCGVTFTQTRERPKARGCGNLCLGISCTTVDVDYETRERIGTRRDGCYCP